MARPNRTYGSKPVIVAEPVASRRCKASDDIRHQATSSVQYHNQVLGCSGSELMGNSHSQRRSHPTGTFAHSSSTKFTGDDRRESFATRQRSMSDSPTHRSYLEQFDQNLTHAPPTSLFVSGKHRGCHPQPTVFASSSRFNRSRNEHGKVSAAARRVGALFVVKGYHAGSTPTANELPPEYYAIDGCSQESVLPDSYRHEESAPTLSSIPVSTSTLSGFAHLASNWTRSPVQHQHSRSGRWTSLNLKSPSTPAGNDSKHSSQSPTSLSPGSNVIFAKRVVRRTLTAPVASASRETDGPPLRKETTGLLLSPGITAISRDGSLKRKIVEPPAVDTLENTLSSPSSSSVSAATTTGTADRGYPTSSGRIVAHRSVDMGGCVSTTEDDGSECDSFPSFLKVNKECGAGTSRSSGEERRVGEAGEARRDASKRAQPTAKMHKFLRPSRFSNVPPTVRFSLPNEQIEKPKRSIRKMLKWCHNSLIPKVIRKALANSYFQIVPENTFWIGYWGKHLRSSAFHNVLAYQKVNHFPGTFHLGRKDRLWTNIQRMMIIHGPEEFTIMPKTYVLPRDGKKLKARMRDSNQTQQFILKPPASARGTGIKIVHRWSQVAKKQSLIAQVYIERPFLISGSKFDLRLYVYITCFHPLRVYMYEDGLVRFASVKYSNSLKTIGNKFMHLTNYSVNKAATPDDQDRSVTGSKWRVRDLWRYLADLKYDVRVLMEQLVDLILKSIICCESSVNTFIRQNTSYPFSCHELFGFDIMLDENMKPWLLEVNISPSLHSGTELDVEVKSKIARDVLNLSGVQIPSKNVKHETGPRLSLSVDSSVGPPKPYCLDLRVKPSPELSADEQAKQEFYGRACQESGAIDPTILDCLTPNDVRVLIDSEDEWERRGGFTRLFPSPFSSSYLRYFDRPRYYNLLLDEWMTQYYHIRETGVAYLESLCRMGVHLQKECTFEKHQWLKSRSGMVSVTNASPSAAGPDNLASDGQGCSTGDRLSSQTR